ncbi:S-adenosyl-L-methionine-dependent methyltransferase [Stachybotrys elegans]|uniref:tRNA (adenine(58)-N(1))-methyltransferase catalytic subunit TRM61 n=1 Tax=Stachybotrys elegans TaxID=80388 RepID=A0A8K0WSA6_9HYPO|nr:S-adenosyl-L-methionine-dependent methyltransferase [Stachybotrys elegans]
MAEPSPFLEHKPTTTPGVLAIALLSRDNYQPVTLEQSAGAVDGYAEGVVLNTRFGSFPHSTLLNIPWGSQVPVAASSGFIHILRPTPELWTSSLPHRTQVVYTPDYSYILHRIRARPGTRIIEAGAGSGSFTHASARAVYNGYPTGPADQRGKVFSFEFHEPRYEKMKEEIKGHGLEGVVQITHRDVYQDGFLVDGQSPQATAVFLDVPAPWEALPHLSRRRIKKEGANAGSDDDWKSPLDPEQSVYICTFSPCIEQVTRTVEEMRNLGWTDVDMVEISHKRYNVVRERVGINLPNERGFNQSPADVSEAILRLRDINKRASDYQKSQIQANGQDTGTEMDIDVPPGKAPDGAIGNVYDDEKPWTNGRICHRVEGDIKTHTSYLVFAILPREWDEEAEAAAMAKWPCGKETKTIGSMDKLARKQEKREMLQAKKKVKQDKKNAAVVAQETSASVDAST